MLEYQTLMQYSKITAAQSASSGMESATEATFENPTPPNSSETIIL